MNRAFAAYWLGAGVLVLGFNVSGAMASVIKPMPPGALGARSTATPAAMCGYTCRSGGRYIPGPPQVCYDRGLEYCGPSRDRGPSVVVPLPGGGGVGVYGRDRPRSEEFGSRCRTVTIERDDGSIRRIRRCD
jgi:hypothetical protein